MREIPFDPSIIGDWIDPAVMDFPTDEEKDAANFLKDAVEDLPEPDRTVVEGIIWGRLSKAEIARSLGKSRPYVSKVWGRALERLHEMLG